jgi:hypothetical protein
MWGFATIRRIAAALDMLDGEVATFREANEKCVALQDEKRKQNEEMKGQLRMMEKAQILLKGSVSGLEDIQKQNEGMNDEREELLGKRRELGLRMQKDMADLNQVTLRAAREELEKRVKLFFQELAGDEECVIVDSPDWVRLKDLLKSNSIELDPSAGPRGYITKNEFLYWLDYCMQHHFKRLEFALKRNTKLHEQIDALKNDKQFEKQ